MKSLLIILGVLLMIIGIALVIGLGIFAMCIGGIFQIATHLNPVNGVEIAWGFIKFWFGGTVGILAGSIPFLIGASLVKAGTKD